MAVCPNCGAANADNNKFCSGCGAMLPVIEQAQPVQAAQQPVIQPVQPSAAPVYQPARFYACYYRSFLHGSDLSVLDRLLHNWFL